MVREEGEGRVRAGYGGEITVGAWHGGTQCELREMTCVVRASYGQSVRQCAVAQ